MKRTAKKPVESCPRCGDAHSRVPARKEYDPRFQVTPEYRESLPDMMGPAGQIQGADVPIQQVGVSNFRLPLRFATKGGTARELGASVTGTVALGAGAKGINMSRIVRTFYAFAEKPFTPELLPRILGAYRKELGSPAARLRVRFSYPILQPALRSGLAGWQFYECAYEAISDNTGRARRLIHFDFVYSSACPCSDELSEHAREGRGIYSIPHSQRSKARVTVEVAEGRTLAIEDLQKLCAKALSTETQVMVKREDEQAFAELNGAYSKFVEDAVRLLHQQFDTDKRIADFQIVCAHLESLHPHDAVAVIVKGVPGGFRGDFADFGSLVC